MIGEQIGRYQITALLGKGGMAAVYKAHDQRLNRDVAIKLILPGFEHSDIFLKRFEREAKSVAQLAHPNIVSVIDYGTYNNQPYLVMEYISGGSLKDKIGQPMDWSQAARLLAPVARALHYAHQQSIIHRDLKPANLLITQSGDLMLSDFGIAKLVDSEVSSQLTASGESIGTPAYMAPEQGLGKPVDPRSDVYSLGIVFYELVTGHSPFDGDTPVAVMLKHITEPLPSPREFVPQIPLFVEQVLLTALAKEPDQRYADMAAFAEDLGRISIGMETERSAGHRPAAVASAPTRQSAPPTHPPQSRPSVPVAAYPTNAPQSMSNYAKHLLWIAPLLLLMCAIIAISGVAIGSKFFSENPGPTQPMVFTAPQQVETPIVESAVEPTRPEEAEELSPTKASAPTRTIKVVVGEKATKTPTAPPTEPPRPEASNTPEVTPTEGVRVSSKDHMVMVLVPAGDFWMGATNSDQEADTDERPRHQVYLDAFWIDQTEITIAMFEQFTYETGYTTEAELAGESYVYGANGWKMTDGANWRHPFGPESDSSEWREYPVMHISWADASQYCSWAGRRLPTEAEWEKAARGTDDRLYPWGNTIDCTRTRYGGCDAGFPMAGEYTNGASPYGALDMAGGLWEWVSDWYAPDYYSESPKNNPSGPRIGGLRVMRGGSWLMDESYLRTTNRSDIIVDQTWQTGGFRCAATP